MACIKLSIHGFYGHGNLGDEAILTALLQEFGKNSDAEITIFSSKPKKVSKVHKVKCINVEGWLSALPRIYQIKTSDLFVLGGGGLLKDYGNDSSNLQNWLKLLRLAKKLNVKTALCAVGVENIRYDTSRRLIREAVSGVNIITVRDKESRDILRSIGVEDEITVVADAAILLPDTPPKIRKNLSFPPKVIVSVRHWYDEGFYIKNPQLYNRLKKSISAAADYVAEHYDAAIDFVPLRTTSYDDDRIVSKEVMAGMKFKKNAKIHNDVPGTKEFIEMLKHCTIVIGMRLHSLILASSLGIPVIGLEYMPKVRAYMNSIGQNEYSFDLKTMCSNELIDSIENTFENYHSRSRKIVLEISKFQKITRESVYQLIKLASSNYN